MTLKQEMAGLTKRLRIHTEKALFDWADHGNGVSMDAALRSEEALLVSMKGIVDRAMGVRK